MDISQFGVLLEYYFRLINERSGETGAMAKKEKSWGQHNRITLTRVVDQRKYYLGDPSPM